MYHLEIATNYIDDHLTEISFSAKNRYFQGRTRLYINESSLIEIGEQLVDFSNNPSKSINFDIGTDDVYGKVIGNIKQHNARGICKFDLEIIGTIDYPLEEGKLNLIIYICLNEIYELGSKLKSIPQKVHFKITHENNEDATNI